MTEHENKFLIGLEKLTRETGITIGGCGCCGGQFLDEADQDELHKEAGFCDEE